MARNASTPELRVHLTLKSRNKKTGPIPVSTTSEKTCPTACPFSLNGCYAETGPLAMFWRKVTEAKEGVQWREFLGMIRDLPAGILWRHNQAGDLPGDRVKLDADKVAQLARANAGKRGFTYTHYPPSLHNRRAIQAANQAGFVVNLSANNLGHADALADYDCAPVVCVLPDSVDGNATRTLETPMGRTVAVCPATYLDTDCARCGLCARGDRKVIVGFPAHGTSKKKAAAIAAA
jgi:hypothetical protein